MPLNIHKQLEALRQTHYICVESPFLPKNAKFTVTIQAYADETEKAITCHGNTLEDAYTEALVAAQIEPMEISEANPTAEAHQPAGHKNENNMDTKVKVTVNVNNRKQSRFGRNILHKIVGKSNISTRLNNERLVFHCGDDIPEEALAELCMESCYEVTCLNVTPK